jgi:hypothetical protein
MRAVYFTLRRLLDDVSVVRIMKVDGGDIHVSRFRIEVRDSAVPFEKKTLRRKRPALPPPVSYRRGSDFVASGHMPE